MSQYPSEGDFLGSGTVLRGYEIKSVVGRGGFGVVYKGHHRILDSDVAIKEFFPRELARRRSGIVQPMESGCEESFQDGLQRFMAEGRRLEALRDHPNIVICRDLFLTNGTSYMVMDFVDGLPLSALLGQREKNGDPFTEEDLLDVILPLLAGLKRVHESGLYHRDIKPSNILIRRQDNQPVLIDFGAAKQESSGATKSMAPYTDGYAAMEQVGEGTIGPWTDIYGVGALMWRMVAGGGPPWVPPSPTKVQHRALEVLQGGTDPLPPASAVGSGRFSPRLLKSIDQCLTISDSSRIRSCDQLLVKIRECTVVAVPPPAAMTGRVRKTVSQPRLKQQVRTRPNQSAALRWPPRSFKSYMVLLWFMSAVIFIGAWIEHESRDPSWWRLLMVIGWGLIIAFKSHDVWTKGAFDDGEPGWLILLWFLYPVFLSAVFIERAIDDPSWLKLLGVMGTSGFALGPIGVLIKRAIDDSDWLKLLWVMVASGWVGFLIGVLAVSLFPQPF